MLKNQTVRPTISYDRSAELTFEPYRRSLHSSAQGFLNGYQHRFINLPGVGHSFFLFILYYLAHVLVERKDDQPPLTPNPQRALT